MKDGTKRSYLFDTLMILDYKLFSETTSPDMFSDLRHFGQPGPGALISNMLIKFFN